MTIHTCDACGATFRRAPSLMGRTKKYCSKPCAYASRRLPPEVLLANTRASKARYIREKRAELIAELGIDEYRRRESARKARYKARRQAAAATITTKETA